MIYEHPTVDFKKDCFKGETQCMRFGPLSLRVGVVGALDRNVGRKPYIAESKSQKTRQEIIVAKIIEFYIPNSFRKKVT